MYKTSPAQLKALAKMRDKYRNQGRKTVSASVSPLTLDALGYLRRNTRGGFNFRKFIETKLLEEAINQGYELE